MYNVQETDSITSTSDLHMQIRLVEEKQQMMADCVDWHTFCVTPLEL